MPTVNFKVVPADARTSDEGLYIHFLIDTEQFVAVCLDGKPPDGPVATVMLIDQFFQDRLDAICRFRDAALHHRTSPDTRLTPQRRQRLIESLRAIDARQAGGIQGISGAGNAVSSTVTRRARGIGTLAVL